MLAIAGCIVMDCIVIVGGARDVALVSPAAVKPPALKAPAAAASPAGSPALLSKDVPLSPEAAMASEPAPVAYGLNK